MENATETQISNSLILSLYSDSPKSKKEIMDNGFKVCRDNLARSLGLKMAMTLRYNSYSNKGIIKGLNMPKFLMAKTTLLNKVYKCNICMTQLLYAITEISETKVVFS